ncbi:hypothetical protein [Arthrobacter sp. CAN_C5]|uniref:hypothetical protein n=1 Tax=Arthrobacter sp. CAN_C5 TaxID=2760706 RepID=UPI001AE88755|nr:hypothetical protein [Arthrobacter sp. CAN_C5]MBP2216055.1 hypothetical protein [Arthrobacter sp. CAN_C5]
MFISLGFSVFISLGFDAVGDEVFTDLVISRIVEPTSLLDAGLTPVMFLQPAGFIVLQTPVR